MPKNAKPQAVIVKKDRICDAFFKMDKYTIEMDRHDGGKQTLERLVFERGHAVAILGYDPDRDEVLLVNEMRAGILAAGDYPFRDATPAGMIDKGENALQAAKREMLEETGLRLKHARLIHTGAFVSAGGSSEKLALVVGIVDMRKAGGVHGHVSEGEDIKTVIVSCDEFIRRAETSKLVDMKSLVFAYWLQINKKELQAKYKTPKAVRESIKTRKPKMG